MADFTPTDEQVEAVRLAMTGGHLAINAGAGCGKSSQLRLIAEAKAEDGKGDGIYVAFNRRVVEDAVGLFPRSVSCSTAHGLAMKAVGRAYQHRLNGRRMKSADIARHAGIQPMTIATPFGSKRLAAGFLAGILMRSVNRFCQTADPEPTWEHVVTPQTMRDDKDLMREWQNVRRALEPALRKAWADQLDPNGVTPYGHDSYLKSWQLSSPRLACDYLLADEGQDLWPSWLAIMEGQRDHCQLVVVGDENQELYRWRSSQNAMEITEVDHRAVLSQCQPPGTMVRLAIPVNGREMTHRDVPIETVKTGDLVVSWFHRGIRKRGKPVTDVAIRQYEGPMVIVEASGRVSRYAPNHECVVVLGDPVGANHVVYLMRRNGQYRIGRCPWRYQNGIGPIRRAVQQSADALWVLSYHETKEDAALEEYLLQTQFGIPGVMFRDHGNGVGLRRSYVFDIDTFWMKIGDNRVEALGCLEHHGLLIDYPLWSHSDHEGPRAGWTTQLVTAAANLVSGMKMYAVDAIAGISNGSPLGFVPWSAWSPIDVRREWYKGPIYSLSVADDHTYVADGIVTHNSFRFGPEIADKANEVLEMIGSSLRMTGAGSPGRVGPVDFPDLILCRTNAVTVRTALEELDGGGTPHIIGGAIEVVSFARGARDLQNEGWSYHPDLCCFGSWAEVVEYTEQDELGGELALLVKLVEDFGADRIAESFGSMPDREDASLIVSTVHRMKGGEAASVQLAGDFPEESENRSLTDEDYKVAYVAVTRAKTELDCTQVAMLNQRPKDSAPAASLFGTVGP